MTLKTFKYCQDTEVKQTYSKDSLFLGELPCDESPEVDVGFATGDDTGAVTGVELHSKHSLVGTLRTHTENRENLEQIGKNLQ